MIRPTKENIDKYLGEGIYGRLPVISAYQSGYRGRGDDILFRPIVWPICKITGYQYSDYMNMRHYLIALDPQGIYIYIYPSAYEASDLQFIKFTDINKLYVKRGIMDPLILTIKTLNKRRYKIEGTTLYPTNYPNNIPFKEKYLYIRNIQKETANLFYESLKPLEGPINSGKYRELHQ